MNFREYISYISAYFAGYQLSGALSEGGGGGGLGGCGACVVCGALPRSALDS